MEQKISVHPKSVQQKFPDDHLLVEMGVESYLGIPLFDSSGNAMGMLVTMHDKPMDEPAFAEPLMKIFAGRTVAEIERLRSVEALQKSEKRFRDVITSTSDWIWEVDLEGRYTYCSEQVKKILGYTVSEMSGKYPYDLMQPKEAARIKNIFKKLSKRHDPIVNLENWSISKEGCNICVLTNGIPFYDEQGNFIGYRGANKNITNRKLAEEALRDNAQELRKHRDHLDKLVKERTIELTKVNKQLKQEIAEHKQTEENLQLFRNLINQSSDAVFVIDPKTSRFLDANNKAFTNLGYNHEELISKRVIDIEAIIPDDFSWKKHVREVRKQGGMLLEGEHKRKDGTIFPVESNVKYIIHDKQDYMVAVVRDITKRKRAENELQRKHHIQSAMNMMLSSSMKPYNLKETLDRVLEYLVSIPWLALQSKGIIFLVEDKPDELVMKSYKNIPAKLQAMCARVHFEKCICGRAALTGKIQFTKCVDERHQVICGDVSPHGHYCVPILSAGKSLGALNLYVKEGHARNKEEEDFLQATANVLAGIIERKQTEEKLKSAYRTTYAIIEGSPFGVYVVNDQGNIDYVNPAMVNMSGATYKQFMNLNVFDLPTYRKIGLSKKIKAGFEAESFKMYAIEYISYYSNKHTVRNFTGIPLEEEDKKKVLMIVEDITQQKHTAEELAKHRQHLEELVKERTTELIKANKLLKQEIKEREQAAEALKKSEAQLRTAIDSMPFYFFALDKSNRYFLQNAKLKRDWGDIIGKCPEDLTDNKDVLALWKTNNRKAFAGETVAEEVSYELKGEQKHFYNVISPIRDAEQILGIMGINVDISKRKQAEEKLKQNTQKLRKLIEEIIHAVEHTVEMRDSATAGHQRRVTELAAAIAREMCLPEEQIDGLCMASAIHDIGKINIPVSVLNKPCKLSEVEFGLVKTHSQIGYDIFKAIEFPQPVAQIILQHHERLDGSGYPAGLSGEDILLEARILGVADVVEAMCSRRIHRPTPGIDKALAEVSQHKGLLYDAKVVDSALKLFREKKFEFK